MSVINSACLIFEHRCFVSISLNNNERKDIHQYPYNQRD